MGILSRRRTIRMQAISAMSENLDWIVKQLEWYQSAHDTQKLLIKNLQEKLGEEAEFDPDEDPKTRRLRREYDKRVDQYADRMDQLQTDIHKVTKEPDDAQEEANDA
jgi:predicted metal-dependent hydrolase